MIAGDSTDWPPVAVVGAGAVGCYFGGMLARAGAPVTLIGRQHLVDAVANGGLALERGGELERIPISATTDISSVRDARIVLFCVKTVDTDSAAASMASHLSPGCVVISMQNGVNNVARIREAARISPVAAVVYVAAAMAAPGHVKHSGRGDLILGDPLSTGAHLAPIAAMLQRAAVPCEISQNIAADLWTKMIMNCAYNAISALGHVRYGQILQNAAARDVMLQVTREVVAVAAAEGTGLDFDVMMAAVQRLGEAMSGALSSTAQDLDRGRRTEIDSLNGFVVARAAQLGVQAPANQALFALVKLLEESIASTYPR
jgi:2-dehydropantoate 2-reductase